jgi:hypothetical protein
MTVLVMLFASQIRNFRIYDPVAIRVGRPQRE